MPVCSCRGQYLCGKDEVQPAHTVQLTVSNAKVSQIQRNMAGTSSRPGFQQPTSLAGRIWSITTVCPRAISRQRQVVRAPEPHAQARRRHGGQTCSEGMAGGRPVAASGARPSTSVWPHATPGGDGNPMPEGGAARLEFNEACNDQAKRFATRRATT